MTTKIISVSKQKSLIIDSDVHSGLKDLCNDRNLKIGGVVNKLLKYLIETNKIDEILDEIKAMENPILKTKYYKDVEIQ